MTGQEPWIGDPVVDDGNHCGFGSGPLGEGPKCTNTPTLHLLSESAIHGMVALSTCDQHASIARAAGTLNDEHPYGPDCQNQSTLWSRLGRCLPDTTETVPCVVDGVPCPKPGCIC